MAESAKEFWRHQYSTGGGLAKQATMREMRPDWFWVEGAWEVVGPLDATGMLPKGGSGWRDHTVARDAGKEGVRG